MPRDYESLRHSGCTSARHCLTATRIWLFESSDRGARSATSCCLRQDPAATPRSLACRAEGTALRLPTIRICGPPRGTPLWWHPAVVQQLALGQEVVDLLEATYLSIVDSPVDVVGA